jgi:phospholipase/carboxylesterase
LRAACLALGWLATISSKALSGRLRLASQFPDALQPAIDLLGDGAVRHDTALSYEWVAPRAPSPGAPPLLVLLHGYAANEADLLGLVPYLDDRFAVAAARAPHRLGVGSYGWFRVTYAASGPIVHEGEEGESRTRLAAFLDEIIARQGIDPRAVYLLGFSQGATLALGLALTVPEQVAGVVAIGGRVLREVAASFAPAERIRGLEVFAGYGVHDDRVPIGRGRSTCELLRGLGVELTYREYACGHRISPEMMNAIAAWLRERLAERAAEG